ncbi:MAG TPA: hypothetical protein DD435_16035 [Cyanobacteria bacterium UBA8530]|nr:hypothetical protein [Cyanobacteria bacterium UBA8530]
MTTLAGGREAGYLEGIASAAAFNQPNDLAFDASGNLLVADQKNHAIRSISPDGTVRTLAGGESGYGEGQGKAAKFDTPQGIAVDTAGNAYVADTWNQRIRKIRPDGLVSTLAGNGASGYQDGAGVAAKFNHPQGVAVDGAGNVYVADSWNQRIRKISPGGLVSTLAGTGESGFLDGREARFNGPVGLAVSKEGIVYVGDTWNHRVRKITPDGRVSTLAGNGSYGFKDGKAEAAWFKSADKLAIDARGDLYVSDPLNQRIRKVSIGSTP